MRVAEGHQPAGVGHDLEMRVRQHRAPRLARPVILHVPVGDVYGRHWSLTGRGVPGADSHDPAVYLPGRNLLLLGKEQWRQQDKLGSYVPVAPQAEDSDGGGS